MSTNPFIEAHEKLPSAISTLPPGYLGGNAAALLGIVEELKRSYLLELRIIQIIERLEVTNPQAVAQLTSYFEDYHQNRWFDVERTHCHNIDRIMCTLLVPFQAGTPADRSRVVEVESLLDRLRDADAGFVDNIQPLMDRALETVKCINDHAQAGRLAAARQEQQVFAAELAPQFKRLKAVLQQMNLLTNELLDRL